MRISLGATLLLTFSLLFIPHFGQAQTQPPFVMSYLYAPATSYVQAVEQTQGALQEVAPDFFALDSNGNLIINDSYDDASVSAMKQKGVKITPYLTNDWDMLKGRAALQNPQLPQQLAQAVQQLHLDGVNIDIENLTEQDRAKYVAFVKTLRQLLPDKEISVAVNANPWGDTTGWDGSYDYAGLAQYADYLMVMAYDEHYSGDPQAGPVGSLTYAERSIQYALTQTSPDKIVLGVPFYGRLWKLDGSIKGLGIPVNQIQNLISRYHASVVFDPDSHSAKVILTIKKSDPVSTVRGQVLTPGSYEIWYDNLQSLREKMSLVQKYQLKGIGSWSLGEEDPAVWNDFRSWEEGAPFFDIINHWAQSYILDLKNKGWINGTDAFTFSPEQPLTRAQAATVLVRALGHGNEQPSSPSPFSDVPANHWAKGWIDLAAQYHIITGYANGTFLPDRPVTREELAAMIANSLQLTQVSNDNPFTDVHPGDWSYDSILSVQGYGLIAGFPDHTFRPQENATRAQAAVMFDKMIPYLPTK